MTPLRYTPRRKRLLDTLDGLMLAPNVVGFQTTDGKPTHLILHGRAVTDATNKVFRDFIEHKLFLVDDEGHLFLSGHGRRHVLAWKQRYADDARVADIRL